MKIRFWLCNHSYLSNPAAFCGFQNIPQGDHISWWRNPLVTWKYVNEVRANTCHVVHNNTHLCNGICAHSANVGWCLPFNFLCASYSMGFKRVLQGSVKREDFMLLALEGPLWARVCELWARVGHPWGSPGHQVHGWHSTLAPSHLHIMSLGGLDELCNPRAGTKHCLPAAVNTEACVCE